MKINRRERNFMTIPINFGWELKVHPFQKTCHWDDDTLLPVIIGPVCESLIKKGLLEHLDTFIRITKLGKSFTCKHQHCHNGNLEKWDDYGDLISSSPCDECECTGVLLENKE